MTFATMLFSLYSSNRHGRFWISLLLIFTFATTGQATSTSLQTAAEQGNSNAQYELGYGYLQPGENRPNYFEAAKWFKRAAEQGHARAQYSLALRYLYGQGVAKNPQTAVTWLQKSAEQGYADAQFSLGLRYFWGQGTDKNLGLARQWFEKAAQQGQEKAGEYLAQLPPRRPAQAPSPVAQPAEDRGETERLIADYAEMILASQDSDKTTPPGKQHLKEQLTAVEVMQAIQLAIRQGDTKPAANSAASLLQQLTEQAGPLNTAEEYFFAGNRLVNAGQLPLAIVAYEQSLAIEPKNSNSLRNLASAYAHLGNLAKAIENLKRAIDLQPGHADRHATLGMFYQTDGQLTKALAEYRKAARLNPGIGWIYPDMADIYRQRKNYAAAWLAIRQAELLGHGNERVRMRLAQLAPEADHANGGRSTLQLRQLVLPTRQAAEQALEELRGGKEFGRLARSLSLKQYRQNGGYWGIYQPEQLAPQFSSVLKNLQPLAFSPVIATEAGFHILQTFPCYAELMEQP